jgi:hypothetical protein
MSREAKNEIDLMLRQLGRREDGRAGARVGGAHSDEQHLDADELSAYVANALPMAARARYMEHLADCTSCRRLVAELSAAEGPVVVAPTGTIPTPSGLKQFLASLFSPMVLRYAVPALGVIVIMVVGFVVMRRESPENFVFKPPQQDQGGAVTVDASPSPESRIEGLVAQQPKRQAESAPAKSGPVQGDVSDAASKQQPSSVDVTANAPPVTTSEAEPSAVATSPVAPPAPKVAPAEAEDAERRADREKKAAADTAERANLAELNVSERGKQTTAPPHARTQVAAATGAAADRGAEVGRVAKSPQPASARRSRSEERDEAKDKTTAKDDAGDRASDRDAAKEKNEAAAETRSVAGRRFRKSGNIWIDTAYKPSQQTFNLARGSEQYRVLVGDEPGIRQIAEQLDGEFIVVWKGQAYRIR